MMQESILRKILSTYTYSRRVPNKTKKVISCRTPEFIIYSTTMTGYTLQNPFALMLEVEKHDRNRSLSSQILK